VRHSSQTKAIHTSFACDDLRVIWGTAPRTRPSPCRAIILLKLKKDDAKRFARMHRARAAAVGGGGGRRKERVLSIVSTVQNTVYESGLYDSISSLFYPLFPDMGERTKHTLFLQLCSTIGTIMRKEEKEERREEKRGGFVFVLVSSRVRHFSS
jgi:hypothetical protein